LQKWFEFFQSSFHMSNLKSWSPKKYENKGPNMHNSNQFMASQNLFYNSFKWISTMIFSPRSSVFEVHFQEPSIVCRKSRLQWTPLHRILNKKIIVNNFQNQSLDSKTRLQKEFLKIKTTKNNNLFRFYLILKYCQHQNLVPQAFRS